MILFPKFHCELNTTEGYWYKAKRYTRECCDYALEWLRQMVPQAIASAEQKTICGFSTVLCGFLRPIEMVFSMVVRSLRIVYIKLTVE